jgi:predicted phage tail protein
MPLLRDLAGLAAILTGIALVVAAMIAAGWWALVFIGGSALVCGGLAMVIHRVPEQVDEDVADPSERS